MDNQLVRVRYIPRIGYLNRTAKCLCIRGAANGGGSLPEVVCLTHGEGHLTCRYPIIIAGLLLIGAVFAVIDTSTF